MASSIPPVELQLISSEVIDRKGYDGAKADIWSCGVILFVLVAGYLPFHDPNLMCRKISRAEYRFPRYFSVELKDLIFRMLHSNPSTRISITRVKRSTWCRRLVQGHALTIRHETGDGVCNDEATTSDTTEHSNAAGGNHGASSFQNLNAFDLISFSRGFDLSNLFEEKHGTREERFTTRQAAKTVFAKLNEMAERLKLKIKKKENGVLKLAAPKEGIKGFLELDAEVFELAPSFLLIELKKINGDTLEYQELVKEEIRPALKDVAWPWQSDQSLKFEQSEQEEELQSLSPSQQPQEQTFLPTQNPLDTVESPLR